MPPYAKFAAMPSAPSVGANPILPDPGSSATAGNLDETAPAATTPFNVPPSAVALPAGALSANPPLPFLAQPDADSVTQCSGPALLAAFSHPSNRPHPQYPPLPPSQKLRLPSSAHGVLG